MSQPGTIYRMNWEAFEEVQMYCDIMDNDNLIADDADPEIIPVTPNGEAFILSTIDNDENPFTVIRAQQATIRFNSEVNINRATFSFGSDNRWTVHCYIGDDSKTIFTGFVQIADITEPFMPVPNVVELTAIDMLGSIKDQKLTNFDGNKIKGMYRLIELLAMCLDKTGQSLPIKVSHNLRNRVPSFTDDCTFSDVGSVAFSTDPRCFEVGYQFTTDSVTNPGPFTVLAQGDILGSHVVLVAEAVVDEVSAATTFTSSAPGHFLFNQWVDYRTFIDSGTDFINCYEVIERILGPEACLFERNGNWWILRIDEIEHATRGLYVHTFNADGSYSSNDGEKLFNKTIVKPAGDPVNDTDIYFSKEETDRGGDRPHGRVQLDFHHEVPGEIPTNKDFERGDFIEDLPDETIDDEVYQVKSYVTDGWTIRNIAAINVPDSTVYTKRLFQNDYEKERYLVITPAADPATPWSFAESEPIEVTKKSKANVSIDWKWSEDRSGGGVTYHPLMIYLKDDAGQYWYWWHPSSNDIEDFYWTGPELTEQNRYIPVQFVADDVDLEEWQSLLVELRPFPASGKLFLCPLQMNQTGDSDDNDVDAHYQNLRFEYFARVDGSYRAIEGQRQTVEQSGGYLAAIEERVRICETVEKLFRGALQWITRINEMVSKSAVFSATSNAFSIGGYYIPDFFKGQIIFIRNANNQGFYRVASTSYAVIGDTTIVTLEGDTIVDATELTYFYEASFSLSNEFYNAAVYPTAPPEEAWNPYSEIQVFDVWNQYRTEMRKFYATWQGLSLGTEDEDDNPDHPHHIHKWTFGDVTADTIGRFFFLMTFEQRFFDCEGGGTFREVYNTAVEKSYIGRTFKYVTE